MKRLIVIVLGLFALAFPALAVTPCPHPAIDGVFNGTEWSLATHYAVTVNVPGLQTVPGDLYIANDDRQLYFALHYARGEVNDKLISLELDFDSNQDFVVLQRDLEVTGRTPTFFDGFFSAGTPQPDTSAGAFNDGKVAMGFSGSWTTIEGSHPLNSGQAFDIAAPLDSYVHLRAKIRIVKAIDVDYGVADTVVPASGWLAHLTQSSMDQCHSTQ